MTMARYTIEAHDANMSTLEVAARRQWAGASYTFCAFIYDRLAAFGKLDTADGHRVARLANACVAARMAPGEHHTIQVSNSGHAVTITREA